MKACPACNSRYDDNTTYCVKDGSAVVPDILQPNAPMIGQLIGDRYKVIKKIGEGGMGEVYVAEHIHIEKRVALKLLRAEVLSNQEAVSRFRIEARSASSIGHDNIISIDDFGTLPDGRVYMAMEFLQGAPLNDILAREPLPLPRALDILIQVARGLSAAHAKGIAHRDMKPENIYVTNKEGRDIPKILDFGIAKVSGGDSAQNLTVAGAIFGTPFYMAPEQAMGGKMDHRVDIYAMGVILYEVFTGTVPFKAETFMGILTQHITVPPVPPTQMAQQNGRVCPPELEAIILKAMQKDPNARYQSMNELATALIEFYRFAVGANAMTAAPWAGAYFGSQTGPGWAGASTSYPTFQSGQVVKKKGWVMPAVIAGVVIAGGAGAAVAFWPRSQPVVTPTPTPTPTPEATPDAATVVKAATPDARTVATTPPDPTPAQPDAGTEVATTPTPPDPRPDPRPDPTPDPRPDNRMIDVTIVSTPEGAIVKLGGRYVGQAPLSVSVKEGQKTKYTLELKGYQTSSITIDGSKKVETRKLSKQRSEYVNPDLKPPDDDGLATPKGM
jgi:tRNA A-37 threonylcarbamoyl transferase component Bud32